MDNDKIKIKSIREAAYSPSGNGEWSEKPRISIPAFSASAQ